MKNFTFSDEVWRVLYSLALCHIRCCRFHLHCADIDSNMSYRNFRSTEEFKGDSQALALVFRQQDLVRLQCMGQVCRAWYDISRDVLRERVDVELGKHIFPVSAATSASAAGQRKCVIDGFLNMLKDTRSVVSGSTTLSVCMQATARMGEWMDKRDLDIFTPSDVDHLVVDSLSRNHAYFIETTITASDNSSDTYSPLVVNPLVSGVAKLTRLSNSGGRRIDVVTSWSDCALWPIIRFPFTHLINYLTGSTIVVCYPQRTLVDLRGQPNPANSNNARLFDRYTTRGWPLSKVFAHSVDCIRRGAYCTLATRVSEDEACLVMNFEKRKDDHWNRCPVLYEPKVTWSWGSHRTENCVPTIPGHNDPDDREMYEVME